MINMNKFDQLAKNYDEKMGENGDFHHKNSIDPAIYKLAGNIKNKKILDLGCGNGYMARYFSRLGAKVTAIDISSKLVEIAKAKSKNFKIKYLVQDASDLSNYGDNGFDVVAANMMIFYVKDYENMIKGIVRILKPGGKFIFSNIHPFRPGKPYSNWQAGRLGKKEVLYIQTTGYLKTRLETNYSQFNKKVRTVTYHRPLNNYVNILSKNNLLIDGLIEPDSKGMAKKFSKSLQKSHYIPTFIIISAKKC